jgi:predicted acylesterase/phospholipase RssA
MGGFAHVGFLQCLEYKGLMANVDTWVGCSIGSLVALMSIVGMSPNEIFTTCLRLNGDIFKFRDLTLLWEHFGLDNGEYLNAFMVDALLQKKCDPKMTFAELQKKTGRRLVVLATNLSNAEEMYLSAATTPDESVLSAVRMSVSVPFVLTPVLAGGDFIVDGGVAENFPLEYAMHEFARRNPELDPLCSVLGCSLEARPPTTIDSLEQYLAALIFCMFRKPGTVMRLKSNTVRIYLSFEETFNFNASAELRSKLCNVGYQQTLQFFQKYPRWILKHKNCSFKLKLD